MKTLLLVLFGSLLTTTTVAQQSFESWEKESKTNKRLLPRYGLLTKSEAEIRSDSSYTKQMMTLPEFKTRRDASDHLINLGFQYYYNGDLKTAMYRFNQAFLLDTTNTD